MIALLQAGYYAEPHAARYDAATMGMFVLIIAIGVIGFIVQARLQSVFKKYSKVQFPGGLTGAEVAEKMLRDNNIHNVKVTHVGGHLTDHFNPQTMTVNLSDSVYSSSSVAAAAVAAHAACPCRCGGRIRKHSRSVNGPPRRPGDAGPGQGGLVQRDAPLYAFVNRPKPIRKEKLLEEYTYTVTDAQRDELLESIGRSLADLGLVQPVKVGLLGKKKGYAPTPEAISGVVDMIRAELLEEGEITEDVVSLVVLMEKGNCLKPYFSAFEQKQMKQRLRALGESPTGKMVQEMVEYVENMMAIAVGLIAVYS